MHKFIGKGNPLQPQSRFLCSRTNTIFHVLQQEKEKEWSIECQMLGVGDWSICLIILA